MAARLLALAGAVAPTTAAAGPAASTSESFAAATSATPTLSAPVVAVKAPEASLAAHQAWVCGVAQEPAQKPDGSSAFHPNAADPIAPWAAKLEIIEERFADGGMTISNCSATAVAPGWLLTAAHCVGQEGWVSIHATLGSKDSAAPGAVRRAVKTALCHTEFDPRNLAFDVALLRLDRPLPAKFPILRLASREETGRLSPGDAALSAGWGRVSEREISRILRKATVRVVDPARAGDGMIVAAPIRHEESLCVGESGAPLVADLGAGQALFGVFSSVDAYYNKRTGEMVELCHGFEARSYFTAVRGVRRWIERVIAFCDHDEQQCGAQD